MSIFKNKKLLITGGTGSFGHAVCKRFMDSEISEIRIFSRDEKKQDDGVTGKPQKIAEEKRSLNSRASPVNGSSSDDSGSFIASLETLDKRFKEAESQAGGKADRKVREDLEDFMAKVLEIA